MSDLVLAVHIGLKVRKEHILVLIHQGVALFNSLVKIYKAMGGGWQKAAEMAEAGH